MQKAGASATQQQARELDGALLAVGALVDVLKNKVLISCIHQSELVEFGQPWACVC